MGLIKAFFIGIFLVGSVAMAADSCSSLIGSCDYYKCVESQEHCGKNGYYLKFGDHYCRQYQADQPNYTELGQIFLDHLRSCLQEQLEADRETQGALPQCSNVKTFAIQTHKYCYQKYNFCELSEGDQWRIKLTAKKEILDPQMFLFALYLEKMCLL